MTDRKNTYIPQNWRPGRYRDAMSQYWSPKWGWVTRRWQPKRGPPTSAAQLKAISDFTKATQNLKSMPSNLIEMAMEMTAHATWTWKDWLMSIQYGRGLEVHFEDGTVWKGARVLADEIQQLLDTISTTPGAILMRGPTEWGVLIPSDAQDVITSNGPSALPDYLPPTGGGGGGGELLYNWPNCGFSSVDAGAHATLTNIITPWQGFNVNGIVAAYQPNGAGDTHSAFICTVNSSYTITGLVASSTHTETSSSTARKTVSFPFAASVALSAGTNYALALVRTDGTGTSNCRAVGATTDANLMYDSLPIDIGGMMQTFGGTARRAWYDQATNNPTSGAAAGNGAGYYAIGLIRDLTV